MQHRTEEQKQRNKEMTKLWVQNNLVTHKKKQKEYRENNKEKLRKIGKKYQEENREVILANKRIYRLANLDKAAASSRKHHALKLRVNHIPYNDNDLFGRDNWICGICGQKINKRLKCPNPRSKSLDHIIPLSKGGADMAINIQAAHLRCNISKNAGLGGQLRLMG